jgi:hypothetical protein
MLQRTVPSRSERIYQARVLLSELSEKKLRGISEFSKDADASGSVSFIKVRKGNADRLNQMAPAVQFGQYV